MEILPAFEQRVDAWYADLQAKCAFVKRHYLESLKYEFAIPEEASKFVVNIPAPHHAKYASFMQLPEGLRVALEAGTARGVEACLAAMSAEERARVLRKCAIGEFFYFAFPLPAFFG